MSEYDTLYGLLTGVAENMSEGSAPPQDFYVKLLHFLELCDKRDARIEQLTAALNDANRRHGDAVRGAALLLASFEVRHG